MEQMHAISFEQIDDGSIRLEQQSGVDEPDIIWLHPEQLQLIARRLTGLDETTANKVQDLTRRIEVLADKIQDIVCNRRIRSEIIERCGDADWIMSRLDALCDLALEFSGGRLLPQGNGEPSADSKPIYPRSALEQTRKPCQSSESDDAQLGLLV